MSRVRNHLGGHFPLAFSSFVVEVSLQFLWLTLFLLILPASLWILPPLVLLSGLIIAVSLWMMQRSVSLFNLRQLTIPALFYFMYFGIILIPGFFIFDAEITPSRWRFLFGIESVLLTVPLGICVANLLLRFRRQEIASYFRRPVALEPLDASAKRIYLIVLGLALVLVLMNLWETPVIPLLYLIVHPGDFLQVALLREDSFKLLTSHFLYAYYVVRTTVLPFLIILALGRYLQQKEPAWRRLFVISLVLGVLYAAVTVEKAPVAAIAAVLGIFYYLFKGGKLGKRATVVFPLLFLSFPIIVVLLAYNGSEAGTLSGALQAMATRIFYSPAEVVYAYFEVFPGVLPFQHGAGMVKLGHLMGWTVIDIPNFVGVYMEGAKDLDTITANTCFIGNFNADFGLPGVVVSGIAAGFIMQFVNVYFCRRPKTVVHLAACALCFWAFGMLVTSALSTQLLSGGVTFALLLLWLFKDRERVLPGDFWKAPPSSLGSGLTPAGG